VAQPSRPCLALLVLAACTPDAPPVPRADGAALRARLTFPVSLADPVRVDATPRRLEDVTITPMRLDLAPGLSVGAALWTPDAPTGAGVVVAHGHFGQGRSAAETQEIAHQLALQGAHVVAIDTPGMEEHDRPDRELHLDPGGAHGRGLLLAGGTNAMALQVALLRVGLDLLEQAGATRLGATGASGGGVQAFYLSLLDPRVRAVALAAFPPLPREARASGCPCDQVPGFPGPDPGVLALLEVPSLWMGDGATPTAPAGLPASARFEQFSVPHTYAPQMQAAALRFFDTHLDLRDDAARDGVPLVDLGIPAPPADAPGLAALPLSPPAPWSPAPVAGVPYEKTCTGAGPTVLAVGAGDADVRALVGAGLRACRIRVVEDAGAESESIATGRVYADVLAGGLAAAARGSGAVGAYAVGAWALPTSALDLPFVVRAPIRAPEDLDPEADPGWLHVPGAWWGATEARLSRAQRTGDDPAALAEALRGALDMPARP
jgi:dienelactone hydrolase